MSAKPTVKKLTNDCLVVSKMSLMGHEQVVFCHDAETGLKAIIAIHNTTLGPALGGTRMWNYKSEEQALQDVLRLSRGMSFKAAISGLELGGGKAVIIGDSTTEKTENLMRKFGSFVDSLGGKYITAEDVGMNTKDMECVRMETKHVTGIPESMGGSGDPSPVTAFGVYENLVKHLTDEGAKVIINDINETRVAELAEQYGATIVMGDTIFDLDIDIYAPCALGATVNPDTIARLKCEIIAGSANNQLADEDRDGQLCADKGILYAPDFLINAGGLINVYSEIKGYDREHAINQTRAIYDTTLEIFKKAELEEITTHAAALAIAEQRIADRKNQ
jgi:leucine dehydrogenase